MYFYIRKRDNVTPALCTMAVLASCSPPQIKDFLLFWAVYSRHIGKIL